MGLDFVCLFFNYVPVVGQILLKPYSCCEQAPSEVVVLMSAPGHARFGASYPTFLTLLAVAQDRYDIDVCCLGHVGATYRVSTPNLLQLRS